MLVAWSSAAAFTLDFMKDGYGYAITADDEVSIVSMPSKVSKNLVLASTVENEGVTYKVTGIGERAFADSPVIFESIQLPSGLKTIGKNAFYNSARMLDFTIPESVELIEESAFRYCVIHNLTFNAISCVDHPSGNYFDAPFFDVYFRTVTFGDKVERVPKYMCVSAKDLKEVVIPNSVTYIGPGAFYYCNYLEKVVLSENLTIIQPYAFELCSKLTSIELPKALTAIGRNAFRLSGITDIVIPPAVSYIGQSAFGGCALKTITCLGAAPSLTENDSFDYLANKTVLTCPKGRLAVYKMATDWYRFRDSGGIVEGDYEPESTKPTKGDFNEDGKVDVDDINAIVDIILNK